MAALDKELYSAMVADSFRTVNVFTAGRNFHAARQELSRLRNIGADYMTDHHGSEFSGLGETIRELDRHVSIARAGKNPVKRLFMVRIPDMIKRYGKH